MRFRNRFFSLVAAGMFVLGSITGVAANSQAEVTVQVDVPANGGLKIVSVQAPQQFGNVQASMSTSNEVTSKLEIKVEDSRFTGAGWNLTIKADDFRTGPGNGNGNNGVIPINNLTITSTAVTKTSGQDWSGQTFSNVSLGPGQPTKVVSAPVNTGTGIYTVGVESKLTVPAMTKPGNYKTTVYVELNSAP